MKRWRTKEAYSLITASQSAYSSPEDIPLSPRRGRVTKEVVKLRAGPIWYI